MSARRRPIAAASAALTACSLLLAVTAARAAAAKPAPPAKPASVKPAAARPAAQAGSIPARPGKLRFPPLSFTVPKAEAYRHVLANGVTVYLVEDHTLPVVDVELQSRLGSFLDPAGKVGVAEMTGTMLRQGGAGDWTAEQLDERADFLAAELGSETGDTSGGASVNCLASALDDCLDLLFTMVQRPRFQTDRLDVAKSNLTEEMKQRNDQAEEIQGREWQWLLYGTEHFTSRLPTAASLAAISRDDLVAFHRDYWRPENLVVAVAGDVQPAAFLAKLEQRFAGWPAGKGAPVPWPPPPPRSTPTPGLYHVEKDIPQARVTMGHLGTQWDAQWSDPHAYAALVMNDILGGGGFTSHIPKRIR
ncbi:MAG TPA: pitrilysin family protein, partial [Thermoanaerobaculia bacterium]|nr:pitrilysin family protein [Thermoanaerobaculia bacterium]